MPRAPVLHVTEPHGEHRIVLVEDDPAPAQRIYRLRDSNDRGIGILGSELADLSAWWTREAKRAAGHTCSNPGSLAPARMLGEGCNCGGSCDCHLSPPA